VTVSEFLFLGLGLILGVASGVAFIELLRARPPARREVRVTVAQDAIPRRRGRTLADDAFVAAGPEPARGGPADRRAFEDARPEMAPDRRTSVRNFAVRAALAIEAGGLPKDMVGMPVASGADPVLGALRAQPGTAPQVRATVAPLSSEIAPTAQPQSTKGGAVALLDPPAPAAPTAPAATYSGPCADERRLADERCEVASRASAQSRAAADALRRAQRAYDTHTSASEAATAEVHPHAVRSRKEEVQRAFRAASRAAGSPDAVEAAARTWLQEINRINRETASAALTADRERAAAVAVGGGLDRLGREADAARVAAEIAEAACLEARSAVAACDEQSTAATSAPRTAPRRIAESIITDDTIDDTLGLALQGGGLPRIFRLLRGETAAMDSLIARLAEGNPEEERRWKLAVAALLDAVQADAIDHGYLRFPDDDPFWGPYSGDQNRDIARALGSLGYRFDGLGGWVDDRLPSQRDLSLALGYAGLDPMRVRVWPTEQQMVGLYTNVEVAGDEYLAGAAGDLTLAEMVEMLGHRADSLVDLWNNWGRVRPLLLEEA
jgi:hypothetical protein